MGILRLSENEKGFAIFKITLHLIKTELGAMEKYFSTTIVHQVPRSMNFA